MTSVVSHVLQALHGPEDFTTSWSERPDTEPPPALLRRLAPGLTLPDLRVMGALTATASAGVGLYAAALHAFAGPLAMLTHAAAGVAAAGIAWSATLPALYVIDALTGSRLHARTVALAALVTVSFGGLAMLASIPVLWFFELCLPFAWARTAVALLTFGGVGLSMADVFLRVMARLEGRRLVHWGWLGLLGVVGAEMFALFGLFNLGA